ncbi:MAG: hypothetical protein IH621_09425 [Krumholzibacteria bacterium]|nr:hypothetical protein [Candidatus Krumholzibacteria bacterium]
MKKMILTLAALTLVAGGALAQNNEIGIYTTPDANPDNTVYNGAAGPVTAYVVLTNPWNDLTNTPIVAVGGFEFYIGIPAGVFLLSTTFPPATVNFATSPDFLCGANVPVVENRCTLITLSLGAFSVTPGSVYLKPVQNTPQSVPGQMAITDYFDDFRISNAYPISGDHEAPVFGLWTSVVPTEDASWGELKSLFR